MDGMDGFPAYDELVAEEAELQLPSFTYDDAWALGLRLVELARADGLPVAVDIRRGRQQVFHAGLPGSSSDNDHWIRRKVRVVERFGTSSLAVGQLWRERGTTFEQATGLDPARFAAAGGCFPVIVHGAGPVGTVAASGLPQVEDHRLLVRALRAHLAAASA
ncbi:heme-degrading domain-containing protein [uncultured Amnibacterium sp.]|uniref:heme-degrading domain-containing protein n=1 Tax=uncultured Amnibacterium sp. TaxID=1631851 RepID=UPI0035CC9D66